MKSTSKMFKALLGGLLLFIAEFSPAAAQTCTPPPAGMVSWWPGDGNFNDIQDGNDGTTAGAVTFTLGKVGQAFRFDGSPNSFITLPNSPNLLPASNQLTIDTWIKPDFNVANQWDNILAKRDGCGAGGNSYNLGINKGDPNDIFGAIAFAMSSPFGITRATSGNTAVPNDGQFHHVAATYDGSFMRVYLDGQLVGQAARSGPILPTVSAAVISHHGGGCGQRAVAVIDEIEFFNRALSAAEIQDIFNAGSAGKCKVSDTDGDGVPDDEDNCPTIPNASQVDTDADGSGDACDACPADPFNDGDGDGICGNVDNCPNVVNPAQEDSDGDGVGNACNEADDPDGDDFATAHDNCPAVFNPDQADGDGDGFGDVCDVCPLNVENDADGDGICESDDNCPLTANANQSDFEQDGVGDACDPDDDNDGVLDAVDNCPLDANPEQGDADGDGAGNACDTDDDNDGVLDATDQCLFTAAGATVNSDGCAIADLCPCANDWKNHGAYVSCVAHTAEDFVAAGLITDAEKDALVAEAAQSNCGKK